MDTYSGQNRNNILFSLVNNLLSMVQLRFKIAFTSLGIRDWRWKGVEVSFDISNFIHAGAIHDCQSSMVSTSPGLGLDRNSSYRGEFCISFICSCHYSIFMWSLTQQGKEIMLKTAQINLLNFFRVYLQASLFIFIYILFLTIKLKVNFLWLVLFVKFFVIGHDCAHKSFSKNKLLEDIVGTLAFLPLIYPYEPWRFKHDRHHAKTNMLVKWPLSIYFLQVNYIFVCGMTCEISTT